MGQKKKVTVIDQLRKLFPGKWEYDRKTSHQRWIGPNFTVTAYARIPYQSGDDLRRRTGSRDLVYIRNDTGEQIEIQGASDADRDAGEPGAPG